MFDSNWQGVGGGRHSIILLIFQIPKQDPVTTNNTIQVFSNYLNVEIEVYKKQSDPTTLVDSL